MADYRGTCVSLIREMMLYAWKTLIGSKARDRGDPLQVPVKKNDHAIDACRYFFTMMPDLTPDIYDKTGDEIHFDPGTIYDTLARMAEFQESGVATGLHKPLTAAEVHAQAKGLVEDDISTWTTVSSGPAYGGFSNLEGD